MLTDSDSLIPNDKITCTLCFVKCFLRVPLACLGFREQGSNANPGTLHGDPILNFAFLVINLT